jgi:hypothetical protein
MVWLLEVKLSPLWPRQLLVKEPKLLRNTVQRSVAEEVLPMAASQERLALLRVCMRLLSQVERMFMWTESFVITDQNLA